MIKNLVEEVVAREFDRIRETVEDVPDDETFRADVMAYALNRIPPRYVSRPGGRVVTDLAMGTDQEKARVAVVLLDAIRVVKETPDRALD